MLSISEAIGEFRKAKTLYRLPGFARTAQTQKASENRLGQATKSIAFGMSVFVLNIAFRQLSGRVGGVAE